MNEEVYAGIKVLVALAQADGVIHDDERIAIENALDGEELPDGQTVTSMLAAEIQLSVELPRIVGKEARERTFAAACALVYVDGHVTEEERVMLERVRVGLGLDELPGGENGAAEAFRKLTSETPPALVTRVDDPAQRRLLVIAEIATAAAFSATLASASLPIAAESCLFTNNVRLARNVGLLHAHEAADAYWRTFVGNVLGAAASWFAITSLLKLVPGAGNASRAAYAATFALGEVTDLYFERDEDVAPAALRAAFLAAKKRGQQAAREATVAIAARREQLQAPKAALDADLAAGNITGVVYANKLVALA